MCFVLSDWVMCVVIYFVRVCCGCVIFFFQAEDGIRDLVRSRGLGDVYKRQVEGQLRGAPSLFDRSFFGALAAITGDVGGRDLLLSLIHI